MFDQLFRDRLTIAKHRNGPLSSEREAYLKKRKAEGYSIDTLTRHAGELLLVAATLRDPSAGVTPKDIAKSAKRRTAKRNIKTMSERRYVSVATKWCNEMGVLKEETSPITTLVDDYVTVLQAARDLSSKTIPKWKTASLTVRRKIFPRRLHTQNVRDSSWIYPLIRKYKSDRC